MPTDCVSNIRKREVFGHVVIRGKKKKMDTVVVVVWCSVGGDKILMVSSLVVEGFGSTSWQASGNVILLMILTD